MVSWRKQFQEAAAAPCRRAPPPAACPPGRATLGSFFDLAMAIAIIMSLLAAGWMRL